MDNLGEKFSAELERNYVKSTYDSIAEEFSSTRYKKWPKVEAFLKCLPKHSLVLDVGCGNGKYLDNESTYNLGCDVSSKLLSICRNKQYQVVHCDMMQLPFRTCIFDAIICVAALHHIVTADRRQQCLEGMVKLLHDSQCRLLIQVWSFEQELESDNPYLKQNRKATSEKTSEVSINDTVRIPVHVNRTPFKNQDLLVPFKVKQSCGEKAEITSEGEFQNLRYYHVFKEKELECIVNNIPGARILESYYDRGNWCSIIAKT